MIKILTSINLTKMIGDMQNDSSSSKIGNNSFSKKKNPHYAIILSYILILMKLCGRYMNFLTQNFLAPVFKHNQTETLI